MHNAIRPSVPLTWLLINIQSTVDMIANANIMVDISKVSY